MRSLDWKLPCYGFVVGLGLGILLRQKKVVIDV